MKKSQLGQYTYIAMTKVDIWEHKESDIKITAIHEYIHSYLIRTTPYGGFLSNMVIVNRQLIENYDEKYIDILHENQDKIQETVATLIEIIYIWYKYGYSEARKHLDNLPQNYKKLASKYKYIFKKEYILNIYDQYLSFIDKKLEEYKEDKKFCDHLREYCNDIIEENEEKTALNLLMYLIIKTAEVSMMIDLSSIEDIHWKTSHTLKKYTTNKEHEKYHPSSRFKKYIKEVLPREKDKIAKFDLSEYIYLPNESDFKLKNKNNEYILNKYKQEFSENISIDIKKIKNTIGEKIYKKGPKLYTIKDLENEAILYSQPYPLNKKTIKKLFKTKLEINDGFLDDRSFNYVLDEIKLLYINPKVGGKEGFEYLIKINNILNKEITICDLNILYIIKSRNKLFEILKQKYKGDLVFAGCPRTEHILVALKNMNIESNIFVLTASSLTSSIDFINKFLKEGNAEIVSTIYGDILIIRKDNLMLLQCMLPNSFDIIDRNIKNDRILLSTLKEVSIDKLGIVNNKEWNNIERIFEDYFKECAFYTMNCK